MNATNLSLHSAYANASLTNVPSHFTDIFTNAVNSTLKPTNVTSQSYCQWGSDRSN